MEDEIDVDRLRVARSKPVCGPRRDRRDRSVAGNRTLQCVVELLELDRRDVTERLVQPLVVEPADVLDGRQLELRTRPPHAVCDQLGLV